VFSLVDYNDWKNNAVQTYSPDDLLKWYLVQIRNDMFEILSIDIEKYRKGANIPKEKSRRAVNRMYWEIKQGFVKSGKPDLQAQIDEAKSFDELRACADEIDSYLYDKGFIRPKQFMDPKDPRRTLL
jgi:hypothetical protein